MSEDVKEEGTYYTPVTFDMGYDFKNFTLGAGVGIAVGTKYRNCFDEFHIKPHPMELPENLKCLPNTASQLKIHIRFVDFTFLPSTQSEQE